MDTATILTRVLTNSTIEAIEKRISVDGEFLVNAVICLLKWEKNISLTQYSLLAHSEDMCAKM